ncbi:MAG: FAD-binding oxidoreductase [Gloeomargaritaceae cyanobacterium C42_A2020_066]|nr:FAD-binding oxidoreductase [Gloeomargaritaceae cyanobacterium C42_A2020_066]
MEDHESLSLLASRIPAEHLYRQENLPAPWWTQLQRSQPNPSLGAWLTPASLSELTYALTEACNQGWRVLACGQGSKLSWGGSLESLDLVVSTQQLTRIVDHAAADLTVTVETGLPLAALQQTLAQAGQFWPVNPLYPETTTVGGIVATADTGSWRQGYGGVRDLLLGVTLVRHDGQVAKAGGRVVKNVAGYDLMKLVTGSYGSLGMLTQVTLRLYPLPQVRQFWLVTGGRPAVDALRRSLMAAAVAPAGVTVLSGTVLDALGLAPELPLNLGILVELHGRPAGVAEQAQRITALAHAAGLAAEAATDTVEWGSLSQLFRTESGSGGLLAKVGVLPAQTVTFVDQVMRAWPAGRWQMQASSGLGWWCLPQGASAEAITQVRAWSEAAGGFLTVLEAPLDLKQQVDIWGYPGQALEVMHTIKRQFDPAGRLSPGRFVARSL